MYSSIYLYLSLYYMNSPSSEGSAPKVQTSYGLIQGSYYNSYNGRKYEAYEGIPYALPPVGKRRFEPPVSIKKWKNTLFATKKTSDCIQLGYDFQSHKPEIIGEEDCLYLNIYTPVVSDRNQLLPVIFYIHGGGFRAGSAIRNTTFVMDRDVMFVSISYRVGAFGFISTDDENIPGNMGLKDQSLALNWVSKNIRDFGGDPNRITLVGQSAGASSVHYHYLSPLSKGLFQNGISLSGSALGPGKFDYHPLDKFKKLIQLLNCPNQNIHESIKCLRKIPADEIIEASKHFLIWLTNPINPFSPVVEKHSQKPFIDRAPIDIVMSGDVADVLWIDSMVSEEGLFTTAEFIEEDSYLKELDEDWNKIVPHLLMYNSTLPVEDHDYYSTLIRRQYFGDEKITKNNTKNLISLMTDRVFCSGSFRAAKLQAKVNKSPVLFWYYSFRALTSFSDTLMRNPKNYGVCHCDDLLMISGNPVTDPTRRPEDRCVQIKLLDLLVSVASEGYPNIGQNFTWKSVDANTEELDMLHFSSSTDIRMESRTNMCQHKFWDQISENEH